MTAITCGMIEQRLIELRAAHIKRLSESSAILGRIQECEMLLRVLDTKEEAKTPPSPKLVEQEESNGEARNKKGHEEGKASA